MRASARFHQSDVTRALRAGLKAGVPVAVRIEAATGDLLIFPVQPATPDTGGDEIDRMIARAKL